MKSNYLICCEILRHEIEHLAARVQDPPEVCFLRKGYHSNMNLLREEVQKAIDAAPAACGNVLLGYGLCGKGLEGVRARSQPLVIPRVHDCISLFLGSAAAYDRHFTTHPGTYYYSPGWIEWGSDAVERAPEQGFGLGKSYEEYVARYGEDNARYLMELEASWAKHYTRAAYIDTGVADSNGWEARAVEIARDNGWAFERVSGDLRLLRMLMQGPWPDDELLTIPPDARIAASGDSTIMKPA